MYVSNMDAKDTAHSNGGRTETGRTERVRTERMRSGSRSKRRASESRPTVTGGDWKRVYRRKVGRRSGGWRRVWERGMEGKDKESKGIETKDIGGSGTGKDRTREIGRQVDRHVDG